MTQKQPSVEELQGTIGALQANIETLQENSQTFKDLANYYQQLHSDEVLKVGTLTSQINTLRRQAATAPAADQ